MTTSELLWDAAVVPKAPRPAPVKVFVPLPVYVISSVPIAKVPTVGKPVLDVTGIIFTLSLIPEDKVFVKAPEIVHQIVQYQIHNHRIVQRDLLFHRVVLS